MYRGLPIFNLSEGKPRRLIIFLSGLNHGRIHGEQRRDQDHKRSGSLILSFWDVEVGREDSIRQIEFVS